MKRHVNKTYLKIKQTDVEDIIYAKWQHLSHKYIDIIFV